MPIFCSPETQHFLIFFSRFPKSRRVNHIQQTSTTKQTSATKQTHYLRYLGTLNATQPQMHPLGGEVYCRCDFVYCYRLCVRTNVPDKMMNMSWRLLTFSTPSLDPTHSFGPGQWGAAMMTPLITGHNSQTDLTIDQNTKNILCKISPKNVDLKVI